ncbi:MAG: NAD(P)/FAD-dependent oxidoreductase [Deltaproteobacteria bacterium]|nr:NAD(P)/FAD-dependent oxidoreductase [Deltaproteobacteria bacterium]
MREGRPIIVGAGLSGLVAGAYLARAGREPLLLERSEQCGGLVQSFQRGGFSFDAGPRALGDAGILRPMLEDLGIELPLVKSLVSTGIRDEVVHFDHEGATGEWLSSLGRLFPGQATAAADLEPLVHTACRMARVLRRLPNPVFRNPTTDPGYLLGRFLPWLPSFLGVALRTGRDRRSIESILDSLSADPSFKDMVCQHFFKGTPWHFALGYFENFQDYFYPVGGTGRLPAALADFIRKAGGTIQTGREVVEVHPALRTLVDSSNNTHPYGDLIWAADLRSLYARLDRSGLPTGVLRRIQSEQQAFASARAGESVLSLFLAVDEPPESFRRISHGHFIHTPQTEGLGDIHRGRLERIKAGFDEVPIGDLIGWIEDLCARSSYEISIPVLKDPSLAPAGKTGLVVSILCDGEFWELAARRGIEGELRDVAAQAMLETLHGSPYPGLLSKLLFMVPATPQSLLKRFNTAAGAITGWSLEDKPPVASSLTAVVSAVRTGIPRVLKAGQWSYSPSGVPVAILTGRLAAGAILRRTGSVRRTGS